MHAVGERLVRIHRGDADRPSGGGRVAGDVGRIAAVTGRGDDDDARTGRIVRGDRIGAVAHAVVGAERHADHVDIVVHRPVDRVGDDIGAAFTAEHANRVKIGKRRDAGADRKAGAVGRGVVRTVIGLAVGRDTEARRGTRDVAAVAGAVERVRIGDRRAAGDIGVVGITDQIGAALDLRCAGAEQRRIRRSGAGRRGSGVRLGRARSAEVRVRVVNAGVDDRDLDMLAAEPGRALPDLRCADEWHADRIVAAEALHRYDLHDARERRERGEFAARDLHLDAVERIVIAGEHAATASGDGGLDAGVLLGDPRLDRRMVLRGEQVTNGPRLHVRDRLRTHGHDDLHLLVTAQRLRHPVHGNHTRAVHRREASRRAWRGGSRGRIREECGGDGRGGRGTHQALQRSQRRNTGNHADIAMHDGEFPCALVIEACRGASANPLARVRFRLIGRRVLEFPGGWGKRIYILQRRGATRRWRWRKADGADGRGCIARDPHRRGGPDGSCREPPASHCASSTFPEAHRPRSPTLFGTTRRHIYKCRRDSPPAGAFQVSSVR